MKTKFAVLTALLVVASSPLRADGGNQTFRAVGRVLEETSSHTTNHEHQLKFLGLADGELRDIVDSPSLYAAHCQMEKNPVVEIEGYLTKRFLFWGGDLVVTAFKIHDDIAVPTLSHIDPESVFRTRESYRNPRL